MKNIMKLFKKIVDKKQPKEELHYIYKDEGTHVATDAKRLLIVETAYQGTSYINVANATIPSVGVSIVGESEGYIRFQCEHLKYPEWRRIVPKNENPFVVELANDVNIAICQIAQEGITFDATFIQDLFKSNLSLEHIALEYVEEKKNPFYSR